MSTPRLRVGVIGAGRIAAFVHVPSLRLLPDACEVLAVASRDPAQAKVFADRWGIPRVHPTWRALLDDPELDAVVICPPSDLNYEIASAALAARKHVLCEKPLALTFGEADRLRAAAEGAGVTHMVAFTFRFPAAVRYLRRLVGEGHFGEIRHWRMAYFNDGGLDPSMPMAWRHRRRQAGAGILADMGSHMIDLARYLIGDIVAVSGVSRTFVRERPAAVGTGMALVETPDAFAFLAEFASGAIGSFDLSRVVAGRGASPRAQYQSIEIHGTGGAAVYELIHPFRLQLCLGPALTRHQHWVTAEVPVDAQVYPGSPRNPRTDDPLVGYKLDQGIAFVRAVRGETTDYPTFRDGAEVQRIVDAVETAARERRWLAIER